MKRINAYLCVVLSSVMLFSSPVFAKSKSLKTETEAEETENEDTDGWEIAPSVDEFGDVKDEFDAIRYPIDGTFNNTATSGSDLTGYVFYQAADTTSLGTGVFSIRLLEYGDTHPTFLDSDVYDGDGIIMKTKDDDGNVQEYRLIGKAPESDHQ